MASPGGEGGGAASDASSDASLADLPLRAYRPRSAARVPATEVPRARFPAIDAHDHLGTWLADPGAWACVDVARLLDLMDACNVAAIVNLDGRWGDELDRNLDRYDGTHPGRFVTFCHPDWSELGAEGFGERISAGIRRSLDAGARGIKVWKDLGLRLRDPGGNPLMPDDPRLGSLWDVAANAGVPVTIHVADPVAFFGPMDTSNERLEELLVHPEWWFGDRAAFAPFDRLIDALESLIAANPATAFIGAHVGCYAEDLAWVERMLAAYPNFNIDIAARIAELGRQPRAARRLIGRFPDRVLFGTDLIPPDAASYEVHFRFLETEDEHFPYATEEPPPQGRWAISGLDLPDEVLRAVYAGNARRLIPGLAGT